MFKADIYEFRVRGVLGNGWSEWFNRFEITVEGDETVLRGPVRDLAELYGLIAKFRNLGLWLVYMGAREAPPGDPAPKKEDGGP